MNVLFGKTVHQHVHWQTSYRLTGMIRSYFSFQKLAPFFFFIFSLSDKSSAETMFANVDARTQSPPSDVHLNLTQTSKCFVFVNHFKDLKECYTKDEKLIQQTFSQYNFDVEDNVYRQEEIFCQARNLPPPGQGTEKTNLVLANTQHLYHYLLVS